MWLNIDTARRRNDADHRARLSFRMNWALPARTAPPPSVFFCLLIVRLSIIFPTESRRGPQIYRVHPGG